MDILVTNDDGVMAPGIALLAEACATVGTVTVVAPDREQSGMSHALTLHRPLRPVRRSDGAFQVDGTPTDCVMLGIEQLMPTKPAFVFSGVNHGPNMGEDVLYSGTVSAAMEAVMLGVPGVAVSFAGRELATMQSYAARLAALVRQITSVPDYPTDTLLSINLPDCPADACKGVRVAPLGSRVFSGSITPMQDPWGRRIYWVGGGTITWTGNADSDHGVVHEGWIAVTPLHMDLTNHRVLETVRGWSLEG